MPGEWPCDGAHARRRRRTSGCSRRGCCSGCRPSCSHGPRRSGSTTSGRGTGRVLAYLDEEGIRLADLARLAGRNKQTIAAILDELEQLGYVHRTADPADRRAKLIRPTDRGRAIMRISDEIVADIEARHARRLGAGAYVAFVTALDMVSGGGSDRHAEHV
ncbi:hypothetical protein GCM10020218_049670 [Dactylosporangium vinaceum]